jgi:hypothetical protein
MAAVFLSKAKLAGSARQHWFSQTTFALDLPPESGRLMLTTFAANKTDACRSNIS